jgi:hypothetical protein
VSPSNRDSPQEVDEADAIRIQMLLDGELSDVESAMLRREIAASARLQAIERELRELIGDMTHFMAAIERDRRRDGLRAPVARSVVSPGGTRVVPIMAAHSRSWWAAPSLRAAAIASIAIGGFLALGTQLGSWIAARNDAPSRSVATMGSSPAAIPGAPGNAHSGPANMPVASGSQIARRVPGDGAPTRAQVTGPDGSPTAPSMTLGEPVIQASGMQRLATRQSEPGSGSLAYALGASTLVLDYGALAVAKGGAAVDGPLMTRDPVASGASTAAPSGATAFGRPGDRLRAPSDSLCPQGIRWRDKSGTELRLSGAFTCRQLRQLAARFIVRTAP